MYKTTPEERNKSQKLKDKWMKATGKFIRNGFRNNLKKTKTKMGNIITNSLRVTPIKYERQSGNSTRLIDTSIQILFNQGIVIATDHYLNGTDKAANRNLFYRILGRLRQEHRLDYLLLEKKIEIDEQNNIIKLIK